MEQLKKAEVGKGAITKAVPVTQEFGLIFNFMEGSKYGNDRMRSKETTVSQLQEIYTFK